MSNVATNYGPVLTVQDVASAVHWLEKNLFFTPAEQTPTFAALQNANCTLYLTQGDVVTPPLLPNGSYYTGLAHIALQSACIEEAILWCQSQKLALTLNQDSFFFNPKVFGEGERYFNITSPFQVTYEVSQRLCMPTDRTATPICGLDHLGVPCADIAQELAFFALHGFAPEFETVTNWNSTEGNIYCSMMRSGKITLEIYQFANQTPNAPPANGALAGLAWSADALSPAGVRLNRF